jgi:hypothetical protein
MGLVAADEPAPVAPGKHSHKAPELITTDCGEVKLTLMLDDWVRTCSTTVLDSFPGVLRAAHEDAVGASGRHERQLVKCVDLASPLHMHIHRHPQLERDGIPQPLCAWKLPRAIFHSCLLRQSKMQLLTTGRTTVHARAFEAIHSDKARSQESYTALHVGAGKKVLLTARMRARAVSVARRQATCSFGTSKRRTSSVTVPTSTATLSSCIHQHAPSAHAAFGIPVSIVKG